MNLLRIKRKTYVDAFVAGRIRLFSAGEETTGGHRYSENAILSWSKFLRMWNLFEQDAHRRICLNDVTLNTYGAFLKFCEEAGLKESSRFLYMKILKAALNSALQEGLASNTVQLSRKFVTKWDDSSVGRQVYLTPEELEALKRAELPRGSYKEKVRDVFLVGCYVGQRFSDYSRISSDDVVSVSLRGRDYAAVRVLQRKTGEAVIVPVIYPGLLEILERWGGRLPKVGLSSFNSNLKGICRDAGIAMWRQVSSHTARRTFITLLHLDGRLTSAQIKSISGHRTEASFQRYLCQTKEDEARSIIRTLGL